MNKRELVAEVAARTATEPAEIAEIVDMIVDVVVRAVAAGDRVVIQDFGVFVRKPRARRTARDLSSGEVVTVPATHVPAFRPGKAFRELVAGPRRRRTAAVAGRRRRSRSAASARSLSSARGSRSGARGDLRSRAESATERIRRRT
jgi:DNA-binding protein HU-beta